MNNKSGMRISLAKKMIGYFLLVILAATMGFGYILYACNAAEEKVNELDDFDVPLLNKMSSIAYNAMSQTAYIRAYYMYGNKAYLNEFKKASEANDKLEAEIIELARTEETRELFKQIKILDEKYVEIAEKRCVPLIQAGDKEAALQTFAQELAPAAKVLTDKIEEAKTKRNDSIAGALDKTVADTKAAKTAAVTAAIIVIFSALIIAIAAARKITAPIKEIHDLMAEASEGNLLLTANIKTHDEIGELGESFNKMIGAQLDIVKAVQNSALEMTAASEEMAASTAEVSAASTNIAEDVQDVASAMEAASESSTETAQVLIQLSSLIQIAREKAESTADTSEFTINTANDGKATVSAAKDSMNTIHKKTLEAEKVITLLNEYSQQIGSINETITSIASQTNLLALNAAIEAARAGEAGKGFAVVAEEVRKLAEQSNSEAGNISDIIAKITQNTSGAVVAMKHSLTEVEQGVAAVNKADDALDAILQAVTEIVEKIGEIARVTEDEIASSDKIVQLIESVSDSIEKTEIDIQEVASATEETNATLETLAATAQEASAMAQNLQNLIVKFRV